ncbi:MAG TPA: preprotein translocase subunit Sec61beta [Candidatus Nanoarchaeia archaeon]|nr:preprotein translocase subunit Sec61beta [Candidatus Nanoarchaeia archaeon]
MSQDNKIRLPSGQGGLTRYFDEFSSKIEMSPTTVIILAVAIMLAVIALHYFGGQLF